MLAIGAWRPGDRRLGPALVAGLLSALALVVEGLAAYHLLLGLLGGHGIARVPVTMARDAPRIAEVLEEASGTDLRRGDEVVSIGGRTYRGVATPWEAVAKLRPGDPLEIVVQRGESGAQPAARRVVVRLAARAPSENWAERWLVTPLLGILMPLFCTALGVWVAAVRPADPRAWILLALMLSFGAITDPEFASWGPGLRELGAAWYTLLGASWPIFMLLFGLYFPERFEVERRFPWAKWIPIGFLGAVGALQAVEAVGRLEHQTTFAPAWSILGPLDRPALYVGMACVGSFFASLGIKAGRAPSGDSRRKLQFLRLGASLAFTPLFLVELASLVVGRPVSETPPAVLAPSLLLLFLFPALLAYVIVVQRAMDVRVAIKLGARYLLAKNGFRLLVFCLMLPTIGLGVWALLRPGLGAPPKVLLGGAVVAVVVLVRRRTRRVMLAIDQRFFRDAYDEEKVLTELGDRVRTMLEVGPLLETVCSRLAESMHVATVAVFTESEGGFVLAHALGLRGDASAGLPRGSGIAAALDAAGAPLAVYPEDPGSWMNDGGGLPAVERRWLGGLGAQLLLPLRAMGELLGIVALGPKLSEQPYSRGDLRLLRNVATHAGLALANGRLSAALAADSARRARLDREIEIAREVQQGLLPRRVPAVAGIDCAGACRPASGVGGDYYDFIDLPEGRLGIAIGDVSGKGIPAALLMASLRASLRSQTLMGEDDLGRLMGRVNHLVHEAAPENRYATFFYARYDPATRRLDYVNAGHNPPMLLRQGASGCVEVLRLSEGGMVVGLMRDAEFRSASVVLHPGDLLVAFTDGISEAMNAEEEEWGEARLLEAASSPTGLPANEVVARALTAADSFTAGAPEHDDMTLVVVRGFAG